MADLGQAWTIEGLEETEQMLRDLPVTVVGSAYLKGLEAGAKVIQESLVAHVPIREMRIGGDADQPALVESVQVDIELDADMRGGEAEIGFGKQGYIANFVEYGHRMVSHGEHARELGNVQPHPFMRPAAEVSADAAIEAFTGALLETLQAERIIDAA